MKISIITPSYNHAHFIEDTINSVLQQHGCDIEHIIMDGGSQDGTVEILKKYPHLNWVSEKDHGQTDAINRGMKKASGDIIAWLNSDDYYDKDILNDVAHYFEKHPECYFLYGDLTFVDENKKYLGQAAGKKMGYDALSKNPDLVRQPASFWRKEILEQVGFLNENLNLVMDFEFFLRIAKRFEMHYLDKNISYFRLHDNCKTVQFGNRQLEEIKLVLQELTQEPQRLFKQLIFQRKKQKMKETLYGYFKFLKGK